MCVIACMSVHACACMCVAVCVRREREGEREGEREKGREREACFNVCVVCTHAYASSF